MSVKLAKTVAEVKGWKAGGGGYIYEEGRVICQGWEALATLLARSGVIQGSQVNWRRMDLWGTRTVATLRAYR